MHNLRPFPIRLGQLQAATFHVTVHDKRGNPFAGAHVTVMPDGGAASDGETDERGIATFANLPVGAVTATVNLPNDLRVSRKGDTSSDLMIEVPICAPVPLLTKTEGIVLAAGAVLSVVGWTSKQEGVSVVGELLLGGGIFSAIYRNSCSW